MAVETEIAGYFRLLSRPSNHDHENTRVNILNQSEQYTERFLPARLPEGRRAWCHTKQMFILTLLLACFPWVAVGWLVSFLQQILALLALAFLTVLVSSAGRSVIIQYAFGVRGNKGIKRIREFRW
ncbi:MAG: hypothetical protein ABFC34_14950 [Methanobacterium sp.]